MNQIRSLSLLLLAVLLLAGCSGSSGYYKAGVKAAEQQAYDEAVLDFTKALENSPNDAEYKARLLDASTNAAWTHYEKGRALRLEGKLVEAASEVRLAYALNKNLSSALEELKVIERMQQNRELLAKANEEYRMRRLPQAKKLAKELLESDPENADAKQLLEQIREERNILVGGFELEVESKEPITLKFKDARLQEVFKILSSLSGINFIFDEDLNNESVTLLLEDATFSQALELLMKMNNLGTRVLNPKTVIVYANNKEKQKQYEDQIIQTFYLSNIDAKKAVNMLRTMLQLRKVYVHEELNAIVVRDTPDVIKLVERMLETADLSDSEVVFDLELIEVSHGDLVKLGPELSSYSVAVGAAKGGTLVSGSLDGANVISDLQGLDALFTLPTATFDLSKQLLDTDILATPKIRVKNREKAKVHVGTREPSITSTVNTDGNNITENVQYIDVGIKVDVEPIIQLDGSVQTKLGLEVSSASDPVESSTSRVFTINTTNAETTLILKDGERSIIGGLIRNINTKTKKSVPVLGEIPLIGSLVTHYDNSDTKREILLSVTPHIVKRLSVPSASESRIWSGGEEELKAGPNFAAFAEEPEPAATKPAATKPAPAAVPMPPVNPARPTTPSAPSTPSVTPPIPVSPSATDALPPEASPTVPPPVTEPAAAPASPAATVTPAPVNEPAATVPPTTPGATSTPDGVPVVMLQDAGVEAPAAVPKVFFNGSKLVKVGETFPLSLLVGEVEHLSSAPLFINYDQHLLEFVRIEEGDFLKQDGKSTIFTTSPNQARGELILGSKQGVGATGASGSGTLATLYFKATERGTAVVRPNRVNFRSVTGGRLKTEVEPFQVEIE